MRLHIGSALLNGNGSFIRHGVLIVLGILFILSSGFGFSDNPDGTLPFVITHLDSAAQSVKIRENSTRNISTLKIDQRMGPWTLMAVLHNDGEEMAVFENLEDRVGPIVYAQPGAVHFVLAKSLETTSVPENTLYHGRTLEEIVTLPASLKGRILLEIDCGERQR
jgi:hypothetical protein